MAKKAEHRRDGHGLLRLVAQAEGYVMVRRKGAVPFVMAAEDWMALPVVEAAGNDAIPGRLLRAGSTR